MRAVKRSIVLLATLAILGTAGTAALAQTVTTTTVPVPGPLRILSAYLGVSSEPGKTVSFNFDVVGPVNQEVALAVTQLPDGWTAIIHGGGLVVDRVLVNANVSKSLRLEVQVPDGTPDGTYPITLEATGGGETDSVDFSVTVAETVGGGVTLSTDFPDLQGASNTTFSYNLDLKNDTPEEIQFGLSGEGPAGWQISVTPSSQNQASTLTVAAGDTGRIRVSVNPPDTTPAGTYTVTVTAAGGGQSVSTDLQTEITGNFAMTLNTQDQRLNMDVNAGSASELQLVVSNTGTAPTGEVTLSATPPSGWDVTFSPETITNIDPGSAANVVATVTPADNAINGDYLITFQARIPQTNQSIDVRATVKTSGIWGIVGIAIILIALGALALVFRRFGRR